MEAVALPRLFAAPCGLRSASFGRMAEAVFTPCAFRRVEVHLCGISARRRPDRRRLCPCGRNREA